VHEVRAAFIKVLQAKFPDYGLTYSIGGQISFDIFPTGWDKTYALQHVIPEGFEEIHFFGDKTYKVRVRGGLCAAIAHRSQGGNDYEIFMDERTVGHSVTDPDHTLKILKEMFFS
jgi:phosphomannomutase